MVKSFNARYLLDFFTIISIIIYNENVKSFHDRAKIIVNSQHFSKFFTKGKGKTHIGKTFLSTDTMFAMHGGNVISAFLFQGFYIMEQANGIYSTAYGYAYFFSTKVR